MVEGEVALIRNIIQCAQGVFIMCSRFLSSAPYFTYPLDSTLLGIHKVSDPADATTVLDVSCVKTKCVLLPKDDFFVAFPLIHTC